jgi:hypothetical protein
MGISPDTEWREDDDTFLIQSNLHTQSVQMNISCLVAGLLALAAGSACAQATIDHNKALAGGITPGYPISITRPGDYKLMGNLSVPAGAQGIEIAADIVTLERVIASLNGRYGVFSMGGVVSQVVATYNGNTGIHGNSIGHLQVIDSTALAMQGGVLIMPRCAARWHSPTQSMIAPLCAGPAATPTVLASSDTWRAVCRGERAHAAWGRA